jgi:tetratricopeptide (TPR) repeat protein
MVLLITVLSARPPTVRGQAPPAPANLSTGITQLKAGDFFGALLTLNDAIAELTGRPEQNGMLARAHAYRAEAYAGLRQMDRAQEAVTQALQADPHVIVAAGDFTPAVIALFDDARRPEALARAADQSGEFGAAFAAFVAAYQALPDPASAAEDRRLREQIINAARQLATAPAIPADAREHLAKADALLEAEAILGGAAGASSQLAATELRKAVRSAPWWPEATFKLASVLQRLQRVDEALLNLTLYKLADPSGYAAAAARVTPSAGSEKASVPPAASAAGAANQPAIIYL